MAFTRLLNNVRIQFTTPISAGDLPEPVVQLAATIKDDVEKTTADTGYQFKRSELTAPQQAALDNFLNSMQTAVAGKAGGGRTFKYPHTP